MTLKGDGLIVELHASDRSLLEAAERGEPEALREVAQRYAEHVATRNRALHKLNDGATPTQALRAFGITRRTGAPSKYDPFQVRHTYGALTRPGVGLPLFPGEPPIERPVALVEAVRLVQRRFGFPTDVAAWDFLKAEQKAGRRRTRDPRLRGWWGVDYRLPNRATLDRL